MFIEYLREKGLKFVVAPYESDIQLAYMLEENFIDYIWSEDSDILAFGCKHIVK